MNTKYNKTLSLFGLLMSLVIPVRMSLLDPGEEGGGGGGDEPSPMLKTLFGLVEDAPEKKDDTNPDEGDDNKPGLSLQQAIAEPSDEEKQAKEEADKKAADEKAAAEKAEADKKAAEEAEAARKKAGDDDESEPIKVVKRKSAADIAAEEAEKKKAADAAAASEWEKDLLDEERDQLELARYAEQKNPTKYKGFASKTEKFLKDLKAKTEAADFDPDSDDYQEWLKNSRPVLSNSEIRILERERGADVARAEATKQTQDVLDKTFRAIHLPQVKHEADAYYAKAATEVLPEEVAKVFKEESPAKAREKFPMEFEIAEAELDTHASDVEELLALTRRNPDTGRTLKAFDEKNPQHQRVLQIAHEVDTRFKKTGGAELVRNGRRFLPRAELGRLPEAERAKYWTFTAKEIADRSTALVKERIARKITAETERLKRYGFERKPAQQEQQQQRSSTPPAPRPTPFPGAGGDQGKRNTSAVSRLMVEAGMIADE